MYIVVVKVYMDRTVIKDKQKNSLYVLVSNSVCCDHCGNSYMFTFVVDLKIVARLFMCEMFCFCVNFSMS